MHEIFMDAVIVQDDLQKTARVLQGYCNMNPVILLRRKLYFEGPKSRTPKGTNTKPEFVKGASEAKKLAWKNLNEQISRQSYIVSLVYDVDQDRDIRKRHSIEDIQNIDYDKRTGTLRWVDIPEAGANRAVQSRLFVAIENEYNLCEVMRTTNYKFINEVIEEVQRFVCDHVLFELFRPLQVPPGADQTGSAIRKILPSFDNLVLFDPEDKWILRASVVVMDGTDLAQVSEGVKTLVDVRTEFEGCVDFEPKDRLYYDTRVKY